MVHFLEPRLLRKPYFLQGKTNILGSILGPKMRRCGGPFFHTFWGPSRSRPQDDPRRPKTTQDGPKTAPRRPQDDPRRPQDSPKTTREGPKTAQDGPRRPQDCPKRAPSGPRWPQDVPRWPQDGPKMVPRRSKDIPRWPQKALPCLRYVVSSFRFPIVVGSSLVDGRQRYL